MSTLKELMSLNEAAKPKFVLVNLPNGDTYDLVDELLKLFGWSDQGPVGDLLDAEDFPEEDDDGMDRTFFEDVKDHVAIFGEFEPSKEDVLKAFKAGDVVNKHA